MDARVERSTGGTTPMGIAGRLVRERERLLGMSAEERAWRAQYVADQHLSAREPVHVPEYWRERTNPIRRFYQAPLNAFQRMVKPIIGEGYAKHARFWVGKIALSTTLLYSFAYLLKYNGNDWTRKGGWRVLSSKTAVNKGQADYPKASERTKPSDYASRGFEKSGL